jgi:hypothetical protein
MAVSLISHPFFLSSFGGWRERRWIMKTFHSLFKDFLNSSSEDFCSIFSYFNSPCIVHEQNFRKEKKIVVKREEHFF